MGLTSISSYTSYTSYKSFTSYKSYKGFIDFFAFVYTLSANTFFFHIVAPVTYRPEAERKHHFYKSVIHPLAIAFPKFGFVQVRCYHRDALPVISFIDQVLYRETFYTIDEASQRFHS